MFPRWFLISDLWCQKLTKIQKVGGVKVKKRSFLTLWQSWPVQGLKSCAQAAKKMTLCNAKVVKRFMFCPVRPEASKSCQLINADVIMKFRFVLFPGEYHNSQKTCAKAANTIKRSKVDTETQEAERWLRTEESLATFGLEYEDDYEYEFSVLSTRFRFEGRKFSKCACSEHKTRTRSRPRTPIWRSLLTESRNQRKRISKHRRRTRATRLVERSLITNVASTSRAITYENNVQHYLHLMQPAFRC